jgi:NAD(P)-dependent dehydrogenase (short-subunit alcohol dehydrogenase family)
MRLAGKVAVVTGAAGGIGSAVCRRFAEEGCALICVDRSTDALGEVVDQVRAAGTSAVAQLAADISTDQGNHEAVAAAVDRFGGLDIFHANAAVQIMGGLESTTPADWMALYSTNLYGVASGFRHALPALRARGGGSLIATASLLGIVGDPDLPAYGAMKGGLRALARSMAAAHGTDRIRVNTICPGDVETPLLQDYFSFQPDPAAARAKIVDLYPLKRLAQPVDVANVALFLASDESSYISGIDIVVDGGLLAKIY